MYSVERPALYSERYRAPRGRHLESAESGRHSVVGLWVDGVADVDDMCIIAVVFHFVLFVDVKDQIMLRHRMARRIIQTPCCRERCLQRISDADAKEVVLGCLDEMDGMDQATKKVAIFDKIANNVIAVTCGGYLKVS